MRGTTSILVVGGLACAVWAGGMAIAAPSARVADRSADPVAVVPVAAPPRPETDAERRDRLNARLAEMVRAGKGSRLSEATTRRAAPKSTAGRPASRPKPAPSVSPLSSPVAVASDRTERTEVSTIAPPPMRVAAPVRRTRGYVAPRLDLTTPPRVPTDDVECLTQALYYEARNESEAGQAAVAEVVINRSRAGAYPRKICDVVYQRNSRTCQFTFTCDGSIGRGAINRNAWGRAERIARSVYEGKSQAQLPRESVNYHANYVRPSWGRRLARVKQIGAHIFYGAPLNGGTTPGAERVATPEPAGGLQFIRNEGFERAWQTLKGQAEAPASATAPTSPA